MDSVSYDGPPLLEISIDGTDYRIDPGKQGTSLSISTRETGTWDWSFGAEARWDGSSLRAKPFERAVLVQLSKAFADAIAELS
jgi:hypothetical protein